jgi:hypothetical protein
MREVEKERLIGSPNKEEMADSRVDTDSSSKLDLVLRVRTSLSTFTSVSSTHTPPSPSFYTISLSNQYQNLFFILFFT